MTPAGDPRDRETLEAFSARRRRERWKAFLTPFITLTSIVVSVGLTMSLIKACQERFPSGPFPRAVESPPESGPPGPTP
jgi:hypothetical protein